MTSSVQLALPIPHWLDRELFAEVVERCGSLDASENIKSFTAESAVGSGENFMTLLLRVKLQIESIDEKERSLSFIVKVLPPAVDMQQELKTWRVFEKELMVYADFIPEFEALYLQAGQSVVFAPKMFQVERQTTTVPDELIILEDLQVQAFRNIRRQDGLDLAHTKAALQKLAQFHAASARRFTEKGAYGTIFDRSLCSQQDNYVEYRQQVAARLRECLPLYGLEHLGQKITTYAATAADQFQSIAVRTPGEFCVLNHGDFWANNIMFRYNEAGQVQDTRLIDFQMSRYAAPAHDLLYLLISSTCLDNKLSHFDYYVRFYHDKLIENLRLLNFGQPLPTLREIHIGLLRHGDWAFTVFTCVLPVVLLEPAEDVTSDNLMADSDKGEQLRRRMFSNSRFVAHAAQLLPWMENRGLLDPLQCET